MTSRAAVFLGLLTIACATSPQPRPVFVPPSPVVDAGARPSQASLGIVLTGGGAFGAWEAGALRALFDLWVERHGEDPPIRVVAGTSTGALLASVALLGREAIIEAGGVYTDVDTDDLLAPRITALLPFPLFAALSPSAYTAGFPGSGGGRGSRLHRRLFEDLDDADLATLAGMWPERRVGVTTVDLQRGRPHVVTNEPSAVALFRTGAFASAMVPLMLPPVPLPCSECSLATDGESGAAAASPHVDGSLYAAAPLQVLFRLAVKEPAVVLTHVVVIGAFPLFPSWDVGGVQREPFPNDPDFTEIGDRVTTLLAEAGATQSIALARAALALRRSGVDAASVELQTGLPIPGAPPRLVVVVPPTRLGWQALDFDRDEMRSMFERGYREGRRQLQSQLEASTDSAPLTSPRAPHR